MIKKILIITCTASLLFATAERDSANYALSELEKGNIEFYCVEEEVTAIHKDTGDEARVMWENLEENKFEPMPCEMFNQGYELKEGN